MKFFFRVICFFKGHNFTTAQQWTHYGYYYKINLCCDCEKLIKTKAPKLRGGILQNEI